MLSAVSRTLAILEFIGETADGVTVSDVATNLKIEKSITSRILATLTEDGYLVRDSSSSFRLSLKFIGISLRHVDHLGISQLCLPPLRELAQTTGELVQLAITQNGSMVYVAQAEGKQRIRVLSLLGRTAVLHASTAGKVWLASLPEQEAITIVLKQGFSSQTEKTIRTIDQLRLELARVRKNGYATVNEELVDGACAIGVPIWNARGDRVLGALVLSSPTYRLSKKRTLSLVPTMKAAAAKLTQVGNIDTYFGDIIDQYDRPQTQVKPKLAI
jgi:DNA-binding IclR family transcriptional regulator